MRRRALVALAWVLLSVSVVGCSLLAPLAPQKTWDMGALAWHAATRLYGTSEYIYYDADPGYTWLGFELRVHNRRDEESCLNGVADAFYYIIGTKRYTWQFVYSDLALGSLPRCYQPGQTLDGWIVFEVPEGDIPPTGTLFFDGWDLGDSKGQTVTIAVSGLPRKP